MDNNGHVQYFDRGDEIVREGDFIIGFIYADEMRPDGLAFAVRVSDGKVFAEDGQRCYISETVEWPEGLKIIR